MANLKSLKPSITELQQHERVNLIKESRQRRVGYKKKPNKLFTTKIRKNYFNFVFSSFCVFVIGFIFLLQERKALCL